MRLIAAIVVLSFGLHAGAVLAAGGGGGDAPKNPDLAKAVPLVEDGHYAEAIPFLEKAVAADPKSADALNYLGYSHRKLGDVDKALDYYRKALAIQPKHRGANEYLGELYLELGQLEKAEERLEVLDGACFFGCEEYSDLKAAIKAYKAKEGS